jgi:hypothetical protein
MAACSASPAVSSPPDMALPGGRVFTDTLISVNVGGQLTTCTDTLPACDGTPAPTCDSPVVGPNDGRTLDLGDGGSVEVAFRCTVVLDRSNPAPGAPNGGALDDLKIWSTVGPGARAVVEVSYDGSFFEQLAYLEQSDQSFDLQILGAIAVRFVRIVDINGGGVAIDAVEAL